MPYEDFINREQRLVRTRIWGTVTFQDAMDHYERLKREPGFDPTFNQLIDAREVTDVSIDAEQARALAAPRLFTENSRRALVAGNNAVAFGVARMIQTFRELAGVKEQTLVTRDMEVALKFLGIEE